SASKLTDESGEAVGILTLVQDITEHQQAEESAFQDIERWRTVVKHSNEGIGIFDENGRIIFVNHKFCEMSEYDESDLVGSDIKLLFDISELNSLQNSLPELKDEESSFGTMTLSTKTGEEIPVRVSAFTTSLGGNHEETHITLAEPITIIQQQDTTQYRDPRLEQICNSLVGWGWETDELHEYTFVNDGVERVLGFSTDEMIGKSIFEFISTQDTTRVRKEFQKAAAVGQQIAGVVVNTIAKDGQEIATEINAIPIIDDREEIIGYRGTTIDISKSAQIHKQLIASQNLYYGTLDDLPTPMFVMDAKGKVTFVNNTAMGMAGIEEEDEVVGDAIWDTPWFDYSDDVAEALRRDILKCAKGEALSREFEVQSADETITCFSFNFHPVYDEEGEVKYIVIQGQQEIVAEPIQEGPSPYEDRFNQACRALSGWIWETDNQNTYTFVNSSVEDILGYTPEEMIGKSVFDFIPSQNTSYTRKQFEQAMQTKSELSNLTLPFTTKDGADITIETNATPIIDEDSEITGYRGSSIDITKSEQAQQELETSLGLFTGALNDLPTYVFVTDPNGKATFINNTAIEIAGLKDTTTYIGNSLWDTPWFSHSDETQHSIKRAIFKSARGEIVSEEFQVLLVDQSLAWIDLSLHPVYDNKGIIKYVVAQGQDITDQQQSQEQVAISEERLSQICEVLSGWVWEIDDQNIYTFVNPEVTQIIGYGPEDMIGKSIFAFMSPQDAKTARKEFEQASSNKKAITKFTTNAITKNQQTITVEINAIPLWDEDEQLAGYRGTAIDITKVAQTHQDLADSHNLFSGAMDDLPALVLVTDTDGKVTFANNTSLEMADIEEEDMIGKTIWDTPWLAHSDQTKQSIKKDILRCARGEKIAQDLQVLGAEQKRTWVNFNLHPVLDQEGRVECVMIHGHDITHQRQLRHSLKDSESRLTLACNSMSGWTWEIDPDGFYRVVNNGIVKVLGFTPQEMIGKPIFDFMITEDANRLRKELQKVTSPKDRISNNSYTFVTKDRKELTIETSAMPIISKDGQLQGYRGVSRDISQTMSVDQELKNSKALFNGTLNDMSSFIVVSDPSGKIIFANNTVLDATSLKSRDAIGTKFWDLRWWSHSDDAKVCVREDIEHCANGESLVRELELQVEGRSRIWIRLSLHPICNEQDEVIYIVAEAQNINDRIQLEARIQEYESNLTDTIQDRTSELEEQKAYYQSILDSTPDWLITIGTNSEITYVNSSLAQMVGREPMDIVGIHLDQLFEELDILSSESRSTILSRIEERLRTGETVCDVELELKINEDENIPIEYSAAGIRDADGNVVGEVVTLRNISVQKQADRALRAQQQNLEKAKRDDISKLEQQKIFSESVIDSIPDMIFTVSPMGKVTYANKAVLEFGNTQSKDLLGRPFIEVAEETGLLNQEASQYINRQFKHRPSTSNIEGDFEAELTDSSGKKRVASYSTIAIESPTGESLGDVVIVSDITHEKQIEKALLESQAKLKDMAGTLPVSHDEQSVPVVQLWDKVLALPLIGTIDAERAQKIMETLLNKVVDTQSELVILDITGISSIDTEIINSLLRTVKATKFLGTECIITGVKPNIAQAMLSLGFDNEGFTIKRTLQDGLVYGLRKMGYGGKTSKPADLVNAALTDAQESPRELPSSSDKDKEEAGSQQTELPPLPLGSLPGASSNKEKPIVL
ncbi:MAG: PAS domain S-box protein, partial [Chloroflexota bacterium]|nr:PAS domain S-box protein [Chloroflexota bacterium]